MTTQLITDKKGKKVGVILSVKDYNKLIQDSEELSDIKAFDKAVAKREKTIPLRDAIQLRKRSKNGKV